MFFISKRQNLLFIIFLLFLNGVVQIRSYENFNTNITVYVMGGYRPPRHYLAKYIVALLGRRPLKIFGDNQYCAGLIISSRKVLTAAHCIVNKFGQKHFKEIRVVAGSPFLFKIQQSTRVYRALSSIVHPEFSYEELNPDLGLLFLDRDIIEDGVNIARVPLATEAPYTGMNCVAYGWGRLYPNGPRADELLYVNVTVMHELSCFVFYQKSTDVICAGDLKDPDKSVWQGDSGGPLLCLGKLTGIISFGFRIRGAPSFFSNVYIHKKWITTTNSAGNRNYGPILVVVGLIRNFLVVGAIC